MTKLKSEANHLAAERQELEEIQAKRTGLADAVRIARVVVVRHAQAVEQAHTPEGLLTMSDQQIVAAENEHREAMRAAARAEGELRTFNAGPAKDLDERLRDLQKREWEEQHRETLEAARAADSQYLELAEKMRRLEQRRCELYAAAGWQEPLTLVHNTGKSANDWDRVRYQITCVSPGLLEPTDPQRLLRERELRNEAYFRNPPPSEKLDVALSEPQQIMRRPAVRVRDALRSMDSVV